MSLLKINKPDIKKSDKTVVILSGGLDSSVNLYLASQQTKVELALTFNYGQRAFEKEIQASQKLTQNLGIKHQVIDLQWMKLFGKSSLIDNSLAIPKSEVSIDDHNTSLQTAKSVWVPNRNGIFLNIGAGFAESLGAKYLIPGFNLEEATTFPDNSLDFMKALDHSFSFSTQNKVETFCFTVNLNKTEIVSLGMQLQLPFKELWPCYLTAEKWCGECESCKRFKRALIANKLDLHSYFRL